MKKYLIPFMLASSLLLGACTTVIREREESSSKEEITSIEETTSEQREPREGTVLKENGLYEINFAKKDNSITDGDFLISLSSSNAFGFNKCSKGFINAANNANVIVSEDYTLTGSYNQELNGLTYSGNLSLNETNLYLNGKDSVTIENEIIYQNGEYENKGASTRINYQELYKDGVLTKTTETIHGEEEPTSESSSEDLLNYDYNIVANNSQIIYKISQLVSSVISNGNSDFFIESGYLDDGNVCIVIYSSNVTKTLNSSSGQEEVYVNQKVNQTIFIFQEIEEEYYLTKTMDNRLTVANYDPDNNDVFFGEDLVVSISRSNITYSFDEPRGEFVDLDNQENGLFVIKDKED